MLKLSRFYKKFTDNAKIKAKIQAKPEFSIKLNQGAVFWMRK